MALRIEDYALIGDCQTAALVGNNGSIDWLCLPRFDSEACFAALLGEPSNGRWLLTPRSPVRSTQRKYRGDTLVLETEFETDEGTVAVIDFMPVREKVPDLVRIVEGRRGRVPMRMELVIRFDYGSVVPWVRKTDDGLSAIAGPAAVRLRTPVAMHGENMHTVAEFTVAEGERIPFVLTWHRSYEEPPRAIDPESVLKSTVNWWENWAKQCEYEGPRKELITRSLITLKALTFMPSGGIVAAPTTSLPELFGGKRNWDYRYCWLRDATFTLLALLNCGYKSEAKEWREWLLRAVAGDPSQLQILYGIRGERRLEESEIPWLKGYEGSKPVHAGNAAHKQFQLDVYGELADALHVARKAGLKTAQDDWNLQKAFIRYVESVWDQKDDGIWEIRGPRRHFTHSKVMAWVALDRSIKSSEQFNLEAPLDQWRTTRDQIHDRVCRLGFNKKLNCFVQSFGSQALDASLLMIPMVGFLPHDDPRVKGTVAAVERRLMRDGFVLRYDTAKMNDGLPEGEGAFLPCSFWLADNYALAGEREKAMELFDRLARLCNDVGLLSEEYDPTAKRLCGNFPQAFSHVALVNTAFNLSQQRNGPTDQRRTA